MAGLDSAAGIESGMAAGKVGSTARTGGTAAWSALVAATVVFTAAVGSTSGGFGLRPLIAIQTTAAPISPTTTKTIGNINGEPGRDG